MEDDKALKMHEDKMAAIEAKRAAHQAKMMEMERKWRPLLGPDWGELYEEEEEYEKIDNAWDEEEGWNWDPTWDNKAPEELQEGGAPAAAAAAFASGVVVEERVVKIGGKDEGFTTVQSLTGYINSICKKEPSQRELKTCLKDLFDHKNNFTRHPVSDDDIFDWHVSHGIKEYESTKACSVFGTGRDEVLTITAVGRHTAPTVYKLDHWTDESVSIKTYTFK